MRIEDVEALRTYVHSFLDLQPGAALLDLGCGRGTDLIAIGSNKSLPLKLVGVDASFEGIEAARAATRGDARYTFHVTDISEPLPFPDESFDCVFSINTLECITDKSALLSEVHRILRPGGSVVFAHFDWDSQMFDGEDKAVVRKIVHAFGDWQQAWMTDCDSWMGRRLWSTIQNTRLFEGRMHSAVLMETTFQSGDYGFEQAKAFSALVRRGKIEADEYREFVSGLKRRAEQGGYLYAITMFVYAGSRA